MSVAGVDEAGRGCLAGPVYAAAVILGARWPAGLNDSKKLSASKRDHLFAQIQIEAADWSIASASAREVDQLNILQASLLAMQRAVDSLRVPPLEAWVDGNRAPKLACRVRTIVGGDALEPAIMAASILAKVARDRHLNELDQHYPGYGFSKHKAYGTPEHLAALRELGPCGEHRMSFAPCRQLAPPGIGNGESGIVKTGIQRAYASTIPDSRFSIPDREA